jgi:uncharacterized membrane protein
MRLTMTPRRLALVAAAIVYAGAGILHFLFPDGYARIIPPFFPAPLALVYISGIAEIAGGVGLLIPKLRRAAAWGLVAMLIAVFPANIYMAVKNPQAWFLWARLPLQLLLIWWVLWCTGASDSPHAPRSEP